MNVQNAVYPAPERGDARIKHHRAAGLAGQLNIRTKPLGETP